MTVTTSLSPPATPCCSEQLDEDEDAMLSALLGRDAGEGAGEAVASGAPNASEFVRVWESDMQAYLAR